MYDVKSKKAEDFINDEEILNTIEYAEKNKNNRKLIQSIIEKAKELKGVSHREAAVLLECELEDENEKLYKLAREIKQKF